MDTAGLTVAYVMVGVALLSIGFQLAGVLSSSCDTTSWFKKVPGVLLAAIGLYLVAGALFYQSTPSNIEWVSDESQALARAKDEDRPVFIHFTADWCEACKSIERRFYGRDDVLQALSAYVPLKADMSEGDDAADAFQQRYRVQGLPTLVLLPSGGEVVEKGVVLDASTVELQDPAKLAARLSAFAQGEGGGGGESTGLAGAVERALKGSLWTALLLVFVGGVLSSFTPCVYPLIPITVALLGARKASTKLAAFGLSASYVGGMCLTYSILGALAASAGTLFGAALQQSWVLVSIAAIFGLMGLSMVGLFPFHVPSSIQTSISSVGGSGRVGAFIMGTVAGVVAAPCVGPVLVVLLTFAANLAHPILGFLVMLCYALGMGLLFLVLGTFSGLLVRLPRSGPWMGNIKVTFGIVFLTLSFWYLKDAFPILRSIF